MGALTKADMVDELTIRLRLTRQQARKIGRWIFLKKSVRVLPKVMRLNCQVLAILN